MRRAMLAVVATAALTTMGLVSVQPAGAKMPPKATRYHLEVFDHFGTLAGEYAAYLTKKTHTWSVEGRCDGGSYTQSGKELVLQDVCQNETLYFVRVKKKKGVWDGSGAYADFVLTKE